MFKRSHTMFKRSHAMCKRSHAMFKRSHAMLIEVLSFSADFGFARFLDGEMMAATLCGSPLYMVWLAYYEYTSRH